MKARLAFDLSRNLCRGPFGVLTLDKMLGMFLSKGVVHEEAVVSGLDPHRWNYVRAG